MKKVILFACLLMLICHPVNAADCKNPVEITWSTIAGFLVNRLPGRPTGEGVVDIMHALRDTLSTVCGLNCRSECHHAAHDSICSLGYHVEGVPSSTRTN